MSDVERQLDELRERIDLIDADLVNLVNERAKVAVDIGKLKRSSGNATYVPARERAVLDKAVTANQGPLSDRTIRAIFRELMAGSFTLARPPRVAFLGPEGSYSHQAAIRKFGHSAEYAGVEHISAVFDEVEREHVDLGLVPVENTSGGGVIDTLDAFSTRDVKVCAEINIPVQHYLLANCPMDKIERVYSKPEVFAQCQKWLTENGLVSKTIAVASTSRAAEMAGGEDGAAAIASELAAEVYSLDVVRARIEDDPGNLTRFLVVGRESAQPTGNDKTMLLFVAADKPGSLVEVLDVFRKSAINMTFIESRPSRARKFEYCFFVDIVGHMESTQIHSAIEAAKQYCSSMKVLGSFPRADEIV